MVTMTQSEQTAHRAQRMFAEANERLQDADILSCSLNSASDSQAILSILAFEVMLKCALLLCGQKAKNTHDYYKLWQGLPGSVQKEILRVAYDHMPGHSDLTKIDKLLWWYRFVFEKARYHYELYEGYTLAEQQALGDFWVELGAPIDEAVVQYFPSELRCLIAGLSAFIRQKLSNLPTENFSQGS